MIYLHRANDVTTIERANELGVGAEVDIRLCNGQLVLFHDPITGPGSYFPLIEACALIEGEIILDFKESGIVALTVSELKKAGMKLDRFYAADLIVPDMIAAERLGLRTLARTSSFERIEGPFWGYWVDYISRVDDLPEPSPHSFLVSPELHKFELEDGFIEKAAGYCFDGICTDYPERWAA